MNSYLTILSLTLERIALTYNTTLGRAELLKEVPRKVDGLTPSEMNPPVEFPTSLEKLLVAGNETLPSGAQNDWNKTKSLRLLNFYGDDDNTDNEDENNSRSRARRLRIARHIGVSQTQLNFAQLSL